MDDRYWLSQEYTELSDMVAISHMWLFKSKLKLNKLKAQFFGCTSHVSTVHGQYEEIGIFHHDRNVYSTVLIM